MAHGNPSRALVVAVAVLTAAALSACGSSSATKTVSTPGTTVSTLTGTSPPPAANGPGLGRPPVTIGDKNFTEQHILGSLYAQALAAQGYTVYLKANIGPSEATFKALKAGQIDMYPEYTGTLLSAVAGIAKPPKNADRAYIEAKAWAQKQGFTLLDKTPFYDSDALAALKSYAKQHRLRTIADLERLGHSLRLGGAPEFATRTQGLVGLRQRYGLDPTFVALSIGLTYQALDSGRVQVSDVFTTDPQLTTGRYTILTDPKFVFGFQNEAPIVSEKVVAAEGPVFTETLNKVSALLTVPAIEKMNAAVVLENQTPDAAARQFLQANGLL